MVLAVVFIEYDLSFRTEIHYFIEIGHRPDLGTTPHSKDKKF